MRFLIPVMAVIGLMQVPAMAQAKFGVVDFQRAVTETAEFKKAYAELEAKYKPSQDRVQKAQQELNDIETQLRNSQGQLSAAGGAELQARGQRKQTQVERMTQDLQEDFEADRDAAVRLVSTRMGDVLKKVATDKGLDLIVDVAAVRYSAMALDVTELAIKGYDAAHPAK
jgi:outer membrane protein